MPATIPVKVIEGQTTLSLSPGYACGTDNRNDLANPRTPCLAACYTGMPGTSFEPRHRTQKRQALVYRRIWVLLVRKVRTRNVRKVHDPLQVDAHVQHTYTGLLLNAFQPTLWLKPEP